jgi:subtilisin family serine protease
MDSTPGLTLSAAPVAISGVDDIHTTVPGRLSDLYGTSAAAGASAGITALILSADPSLTPTQVEQIMETTALPMANSAVSGAGLAQVDPAAADAEAYQIHFCSRFGSPKRVAVTTYFV